MVTVTLCDVVPPLPLQASVNDAVPIAAPRLSVSVPEGAFDPDQSPLAVHVVASVLLQVSVVLPPKTTVEGSALNVMEGPGAVTLIVVVEMAVRPRPSQVST